MARKWRRLYTKLIENEDLAMAGMECEFAERLFFRMIATCDDYGRLPGTAFGLGSRTCPGIGKSAEQITEAVEVLVKHNLIQRYTIDGSDYIQLPGWFDHQAQKWFATGAPEYPSPPDWEPPDSLVKWLTEKREAKGEKGAPLYPPSRYGLPDDFLCSDDLPPPAEASVDATAEATVETGCVASTEAQEKEVEVEKEEREGYDTAALLDECLEVIRPLCPKQLVGQAQKSTLENALRVHPRAEEFLLEECVTLAARHADGQRVHLSYLANNVADACRKAEKDGKSAPAHDKRDAAMLEWQAEIEREDEERRKLEEAEATS